MADRQEDEQSLNNDIDGVLKGCLDVAVTRSDYSQKIVISAMIEHCLSIEEREECIAAVDTDKLEDELEQYVERYE